MGIKENFETLYNDADEYVKRSIDGYKLHFVETLSLLYGDAACSFVLFMLLFLAFLFALVAAVVLVAPVTGLVTALLLAVALLFLFAIMVYVFRVRLFVDRAVRRFCRMLFDAKNEKE